MKKILWWKKIDDLEFELRQSKRNEKELSDGLDRAKEQIDKLKSMLRGERVCDGYCVNCEHHLSKTTYHYHFDGERMVEKANLIACQLDCKCPDFKRKDST